MVAVPNTDRTRDFTPTHSLRRREGDDDDPCLKNSGGGDAFLRFLKEELIPEIDRTYRTKPYRIIVGHSFGALLALHALQSEPDVFQGYIAIDPSVFWDDDSARPAGGEGFEERKRPPANSVPAPVGILFRRVYGRCRDEIRRAFEDSRRRALYAPIFRA